MSDVDDLISKLYHVRQDIESSEQTAHWLEFDITQAMENDQASVRHTGFYKAEIPYTSQYDQGRLLPLLEVLPQELLDKVYTKKHSKVTVVPAKFDMKLRKQIEALGSEARDIVEAATFRKRGTLKITEVKE